MYSLQKFLNFKGMNPLFSLGHFTDNHYKLFDVYYIFS
jgi:hypothetical protein